MKEIGFGRQAPPGGFGGGRQSYEVVCSECGTDTTVPFQPTEGRPVYCRDCFSKQRGGGGGGGRGGGGGGGRGDREMHEAVCSDCGTDTEVPFRPTAGKPVYCRDCFQKHKPPRRGGF